MIYRQATTALLLALLCAVVTSARAQSLTVQMIDAPAGVVVPAAIASIRGSEWVTSPVITPWGGTQTLAGYTVTLRGELCLLAYISPEQIDIIVPPIAPGTAVLLVAGPSGAFSATVEVVALLPRLVAENGYAVASTHPNYYPQLCVGPCRVGPLQFNRMSIQARGLGAANGAPAMIILWSGMERHEIAATAHQWPVFHSVSNVVWWAPPCASGTYAVSLRVGSLESPPVLIGFVSSCTIQLRPARARR